MPLPGRGEAPRREVQEVEAITASAERESPAPTEHLMEAICDPDNIEAALDAVKRNKGAPGIDGITVKQLPSILSARWPEIERQLLQGRYQPQPVRRVKIPKPAGGTRNLGIPTVIDRVIQQAILLRLQPLWDPTFSEHSYGFRPGRSAHQAVAQAQAHVIEGYRFVVDIDLAKFFDRVNHDRLMAAVAARVSDRRLLRLIRSYLTAGVLDNGLFEDSREGTPQGGPLSPLLSNLVLDELDRELERRGHRFVRYADDCNIYVRSEQAGRRVMESLTRFIERRLKLQINAEKSAVARPWRRSFLSFTVRNEPEFRRCIADKALVRFKHRVRELTRRHRGIKLEQMIRELATYLQGWAGYFGFSQSHELPSLDGWLRRRLRCVVWVQWKTRGRRYQELRRLRVSGPAASEAVFSPKGPWRLSFTYAMHRAFTKARFKRLGLPSMEKLVIAQSAEPPWYGPVCPVVWEGWHCEMSPYPD
ncbi:MAG: group II intron reverse transcriptase/maturase [Mesorhizobium sp.]